MCSVTLQSREGSEIEAHRIVLSANELHDKIQQSRFQGSLRNCLPNVLLVQGEPGRFARAFGVS